MPFPAISQLGPHLQKQPFSIISQHSLSILSASSLSLHLQVVPWQTSLCHTLLPLTTLCFPLPTLCFLKACSAPSHCAPSHNILLPLTTLCSPLPTLCSPLPTLFSPLTTLCPFHQTPHFTPLHSVSLLITSPSSSHCTHHTQHYLTCSALTHKLKRPIIWWAGLAIIGVSLH